MTLEHAALRQQLAEMARQAVQHAGDQHDRLAEALALLRDRAGAFAELASRAAASQWTPFRAAIPTEPLDARHPKPTPLSAYTVVAADGSHVDPDRHGPTVCYLLNFGIVTIRYGVEPQANLVSLPVLGFRHEDLYLSSGGTELPVQDRVLAIKRQVDEMRHLAATALEARADLPVVALADGTLLVSAWGQGDDSQVLELLVARFLEALDTLRQRRIAIASYISRPRGSDLLNLLRLAACPYRDADCSGHCRGVAPSALACARFAGLTDRHIFEQLPLRPGERSGVFVSSWATSRQRYGDHLAHFYYLHVGSEIARVEIPQWVAEDADLLALTQATVLDQVRRGQGYPRALIEAHEKAVLTGNDRRAFVAMTELALTGLGLRAKDSLKDLSKSIGQY